MRNSKSCTGRPKAVVAGLITLVVFAALPAGAHHSTAAFDNSRVVRVEGTVTQFRWINPHASFKLEGTADGGPDGLWTVEMTAANVLVNQGWKRTSLHEGDKIVAFVNPLKEDTFKLSDGSWGGLYVGVILADGSTIGRTDGGGQYSDN